MISGMNAAADGMRAAQYALDALAGDIANVNTPGYRRQLVAFSEMLGTPALGTLGPVSQGAGAAAGFSSLSSAPGGLQETRRPLDVALPDGVFLRVDGGKLTRAVSLQVGADGNLQTSTGHRLQPPVKVPAGVGEADVTVSADGTVLANGKAVGQLPLVRVHTPQALDPAGDSLLTATAASGAPVAVRTGGLQAGYVESSSVDLGDAMVEMSAAQHAFELSSRAFQAQDEAMKIVTEVKR